jgi:quercetin dioxygenase-like cupin family protein
MSTNEVRLGALVIRYLQDGSETNSMGMFELAIPPGSNVPPPHSHTNNEECVYVVDGTLRYTVGDESRDLGPGASMHTPRGVVHSFSNPFASPARALIVMSPDIGEQYFLDIAAVLGREGMPDKTAVEDIMSRYGLTLAAPSQQRRA